MVPNPSPFFLTDGATSLLSNTLIGASWYVLNTAANASPLGGDLRVLVYSHLHSDVTGQLNYSVFPNGIGEDYRQYRLVRGSRYFQGQLLKKSWGAWTKQLATLTHVPPSTLAFCNYPNANGDYD